MPIYEYRCADCSHELERIQKVSDDPLTECPACGRPTLKKLISAAGFRLKGGGWYETDFKQGDKKKNLHEAGQRKEGVGPATDPGDGKGKGAGESKPEAKPKSEPKPKPTSAGTSGNAG